MRVDHRHGNLRRWTTARAVGTAFRAATAGKLVPIFRVVHFTIQRDHLHLIVEAADNDAFARGTKGIGCRVAKAINRAHDGRRGKVLGDRYHARALKTPAEVRNAIRYVYLNAIRHDADAAIPDRGTSVGDDGIDPCSSAAWWPGWARSPRPPPEDRPSPTSPPQTWLLTKGWAVHGGPMPRPAAA